MVAHLTRQLVLWGCVRASVAKSSLHLSHRVKEGEDLKRMVSVSRTPLDQGSTSCSKKSTRRHQRGAAFLEAKMTANCSRTQYSSTLETFQETNCRSTIQTCEQLSLCLPLTSSTVAYLLNQLSEATPRWKNSHEWKVQVETTTYPRCRAALLSHRGMTYVRKAL